MRLPIAGGRDVRLTYCTNVHPAETVDGIESRLDEFAVPVARAVAGDQRFGLGLWLAAGAIEELHGGRLASFREFLDARSLYAFTLNAFPYRGFHEQRVKEKVFEPTWEDEARVDYTEACGEVLAALLPDGESGSVSTMPLGLPRPDFDRARAIDHLRRAAERYAAIEERTGRRVVLGVEPEPRAILSTISDAARFLDEEVFDGREDPRRAHLGVCFDTCHEAVMHRDMLSSLDELQERRVSIAKVQVTSAVSLRDPSGNAAGRARLEAFDEGRYFHQTAYRDARGDVHVEADLAPFFAEVDAGRLDGLEEARVHFHVPVFADLDADGLSTTAHELPPFLARAVATQACGHFEVETYTFDVIPEDERRALGADDLASLLVAELRWTRDALSSGQA